MARPVVGIIGNLQVIGEDYAVQAVGIMNIDAIATAADALPLIIPAMPSIGDIDDIIAACDGFLFTGGRPNVHPKHYGEKETEAHGAFDLDRDAVTLPLIRRAVELGKPILGICRGFQEMNVAFGGTLHPEIRDLPGRMNHRMPPEGTQEEKFAHRHMVTLDPDGVFAQILGGDEIMVNSLHGQGICGIAPRVIVEGRASDNTPEAIRIADAPGFALGVQWHPEYNAAHDEVSRPLFKAFGDALRAYKGS